MKINLNLLEFHLTFLHLLVCICMVKLEFYVTCRRFLRGGNLTGLVQNQAAQHQTHRATNKKSIALVTYFSITSKNLTKLHLTRLLEILNTQPTGKLHGPELNNEGFFNVNVFI